MSLMVNFLQETSIWKPPSIPILSLLWCHAAAGPSRLLPSSRRLPSSRDRSLRILNPPHLHSERKNILASSRTTYIQRRNSRLYKITSRALTPNINMNCHIRSISFYTLSLGQIFSYIMRASFPYTFLQYFYIYKRKREFSM